MDIKELNKKQLVLVTLLITFVVSIATGIVTVSLMQQVPKSVPQTINNVIQRTIEKVTTVQVPVSTQNDKNINNKNKDPDVLVGDGNVLVSIYPLIKSDISLLPAGAGVTDQGLQEVLPEGETILPEEVMVDTKPTALGQGIIISDVGLILVESSILSGHTEYKVILNSIDFKVIVLKKFNNGFTVLKINSNQQKEDKTQEEVSSEVDNQQTEL